MRLTALVKVDSKGRITIPQAIREAIGIEKGMVMLIIGDIDRKEIYITPVSARGDGDIYYMELTLKDRPGALAKVTSLLADKGIDIIANRCAAVIRGEEGFCVIVADFSKASTRPERVREELEMLDVVIQAKVKRFEGTMEEV